MQRIPVAFLIAFSSAFLLAGCHEIEPDPVERDNGSVEFRDLAQGQDSGHEEEARRVIEAQGDWQTFWEEHQEITTEKSDPPEVDFADERVVVVLLGQRPNGCYAVAITDVRLDEQTERTHVEITEHVPSEDEVCTDQIVHPFHFVAVPADGSQVVFEEQATEGDSKGSSSNSGAEPEENGHEGEEQEMRDLAQGQHSGHKQQDRRVITSQDEWKTFWETHEENRTDKSDPPEVDFSSERVVAVVLGERPNGCYSVKVTDVEPDQQSGETRVNVTEKVPSPDAVCPQVIVHPFHFVAVPADDTQVVFMEHEEEGP